jgi:hypothetical protein
MAITIVCLYAECRYAKSRDYLNVMLSAVVLNAVLMNVVRPLLKERQPNKVRCCLKLNGIGNQVPE